MAKSTHRIVDRATHKLGIAAREALELSESEIVEQQEDADLEAEPYGDSLEEHEIQASGDSDDALLNSAGAASEFERGGRTWYQLGEFACPPVRYWIDEHCEIRSTGSRIAPSLVDSADAVAKAIACHLAPEAELIREPLGWCHLPAIGSVEALVALAAREPGVDIDQLRARLRSRGRVLLAFGILLPSGECITPNALIKPASESKRASLAGALRMAVGRPERLAGEHWTSEDWHRFERAQAQSKSSRTSSSGNKRGKTRL